jgi:DNA polymerase I
MPETLYLIDGHALAYRMYFALMGVGGDAFTTRSGEPTAGTYGFTSALFRLLENDHPQYLAVAFDVGKTFRDDIFPDYKATREKMPDDLREQIERIRQIIDAMNIPRLEVEGFEADDVLGSVARYAVKEGLGVKIITGDRDLLQLVDDRIWVNLPGKRSGETIDYDAKGVFDYWGIRPDQVVDYKALAGDSSDNIPGVPGVGDKTAKTLLESYGHLDDIYEHIDEVATRFRNKLVDGRESAYLSYELAKIKTDVALSIDLESARTDKIDYQGVVELFKELEFKSLLAKIEQLGNAPSQTAPSGQLSLFEENRSPDRIGEGQAPLFETVIVDTASNLKNLVNELKQAKRLSFDTETSGTDPITADIVGVSLAFEKDKGYYLPLGHNQKHAQLAIKQVMDALRPALTDENIEKVGHNLKYDTLIMQRHGVNVQPLSFDTMIAQWLIDPTSHQLGLKDMAESLLGINMTHIEALIGSGKDQKSMADVAIEDVAPYAVADAVVPLLLREELSPRLDKVNAREVLDTLEMPLIEVLAEMELQGIKLDVPFLKSLESELEKRQIELTENVFRTVGHEFNLNSTQQLSDVLFQELGIEPPLRAKKTQSGHYSTAASVLEQLQGKHEVLDWILEYRELSKLSSTYVNALPEQVNPATGRVHSSFSQTVAVTGRLSSSNPNLQNIPTRTEEGRRIRKAFIAEQGYRLVAVDYSQIELRIVAHMSEDKAMLKAFHAGLDIHAATAAAVYHTALEDVTDDQRRHAKAINFGLIYGMGSFGLSQSTGLTVGESEEFIRVYFKQFPGVKSFLDELRVKAARDGYVETLYGRRRYFPNLRNSRNMNQQRREEREAINAPIQGTAADIMKVAMIRVVPILREADLKARLLLQIHDELIFECLESEVSKSLALIREVMENAIVLKIPLLTEAKVGKNWAEMEVVKEQ